RSPLRQSERPAVVSGECRDLITGGEELGADLGARAATSEGAEGVVLGGRRIRGPTGLRELRLHLCTFGAGDESRRWRDVVGENWGGKGGGSGNEGGSDEAVHDFLLGKG